MRANMRALDHYRDLLAKVDAAIAAERRRAEVAGLGLPLHVAKRLRELAEFNVCGMQANRLRIAVIIAGLEAEMGVRPASHSASVE